MEGKVIWPSSSGVRRLEDSFEEDDEAGVSTGRVLSVDGCCEAEGENGGGRVWSGVLGALAKRAVERDLLTTAGRDGCWGRALGEGIDLDVLNEAVEEASSDLPRLMERAEASLCIFLV